MSSSEDAKAAAAAGSPDATDAPGRDRSLASAALLGAALLLAFHPTLTDLARHLAAEPWARYAALFPLLFARCARVRRRAPLAGVGGTLAIAAGVVWELLALAAGAVRFARPGFLLAAVGLCDRLGIGSWRSWAVLAFAVPLPSGLARLGAPALPAALLGVSADLLSALGLGVEAAGLSARHGDVALQLSAADGGLALAPLLAGLAWYDGTLRGRPLSGSFLRAAVAALLAVPLQGVALTLVLAGAPLLGAGAASAVIANGPWAVVAVLSVLHSERRLRSRRCR